MIKPTKKQASVLEFIRRFTVQNGYSPTYKEIALKFKNNVNAIQQATAALIKKGYLEKTEGIARGLKPKEDSAHAKPDTLTVPLYGNVSAGEPIFADNNIEGYITIDRPRTSGSLFAVTVRGDSMIDKKIVEKDKLIVKKQNTADNGDIVVALLEDEVTVKIFRKQGDKIYLQPANNRYDPIYSPFKILGIVVGLTRDYTF